MLDLCDDIGFVRASVLAYHMHQRDPAFFSRTEVSQSFKKLILHAEKSGDRLYGLTTTTAMDRAYALASTLAVSDSRESFASFASMKS